MRRPCLLLFVALVLSTLGEKLTPAKANLVVWERPQLATTKRLLEAPPDDVKASLQRLKKHADQALQREPYSVVQKRELPPSGDKHDYLSYSRYWWPNPDTDDGLPYVRRDGETNVDMRARGDRDAIGLLVIDVEALTLASYFFDDLDYAKQARKLIQTWFLDPATRMNPHLKYAQAVPGRAEGRGVGIIDTRGFIVLLDCVALLRDLDCFSSSDDQQLRAWFREYLTWLRESELGEDERTAENNHGSWYAAQTACIAMYINEVALAREIVLDTKNHRIPLQFAPDGSQPHELERTKSLHYSLFNLSALSVVARVGEHLGIDLWNLDSDGKGGLKQGFEFVFPHLTDQSEWKYRQLEPYELSPPIIQLLRMASVRYNAPRFAAVIDEIEHRHEDYNFASLVCAARSQLQPRINIAEGITMAITPYELPDLSSYSSENIRHRIPKSKNGTARVARAADYSLLNEALRRERGTDLRRRQQTQEIQVIVLSGGALTLGQLIEQIDDKSIAALSQTTATLRLPVLVQPDSTLIIDGAETLECRLSTDRGTFIANAGELIVVDTNVTSWDEKGNCPSAYTAAEAFRPYISSYIRSRTFLADSSFAQLGYLAPTAYGLSLSSHPERNQGEPTEDWPTGHIIGCRFTGLYYGFYSYEARDVAILGNTYDASIRYGIDPHDRSTRLIIANNVAKSTRERHGIIGSREISNSFIFRNKCFDNKGSGIMLDRQCTENLIVDNQVFHNGQGIAIYESADNLVAENLIAANDKSGVRIRNSTGVFIENNTIVGNGDYAFEIHSKTLDDHEARFVRGDHYRPFVEAVIRSNIASGNKGCVKGNEVQSLTVGDISTAANPSNVSTLIPGIRVSYDKSADREFGGQLKPFRNQLQKALDSPTRQVVFQY